MSCLHGESSTTQAEFREIGFANRCLNRHDIGIAVHHRRDGIAENKSLSDDMVPTADIVAEFCRHRSSRKRKRSRGSDSLAIEAHDRPSAVGNGISELRYNMGCRLVADLCLYTIMYDILASILDLRIGSHDIPIERIA